MADVELSRAMLANMANVTGQGYNQAYQQYGVYGLQAQILYVQNNLRYWRGEEARTVKLELKKAAKMLESL